MSFTHNKNDLFLGEEFGGIEFLGYLFPEYAFLKVPTNEVSPEKYYISNDKEGKVTDISTDFHLLLEDKVPLNIVQRGRNKVDGEGEESDPVDEAMTILAGFLQGLGLADSSFVTTELGKASEHCFKFEDLKRKGFSRKSFIDEFKPPQYLDENNDTVDLLFTADTPVLWMINYVLTSRSVNICLSGSDAKKVDLDNIKKELDDLNSSVSASVISKSEISFSGKEDVTFAFAKIDLVGTVYSSGKKVIKFKGGKEGTGQTPPEKRKKQ